MLIAITLKLRAETSATLPRDLGRAVYAATLAHLNRVEAGLGAHIHDGDGPKPITCSGLLNGRGTRQGTPIAAGAAYYVRVTGLTARVSQGLEAAFCTEPPAGLELDGHPFQVVCTTCDAAQDGWSGRATYEALASAQLIRSDPPPRRATLHFASPVAFKSGGLQVPLPLPGLVFGSLATRWNAFSPIALSPEIRRFGEERIAISRYRLQSRPVQQKQGALRIGGVGRATYTALSGDRYWLGVMQMLADFARFGGVGVQTATGMGQARRSD